MGSPLDSPMVPAEIACGGFPAIGSEEVARVGDAERRHPVGGGKLRQPLDRQRAFQQRISRMDAEMDEPHPAPDPTHEAILIAPSVGDGTVQVHA